MSHPTLQEIKKAYRAGVYENDAYAGDIAIRVLLEAHDSLRSDVIRLAAHLAQNNGLNRLFPDAHPKPAPRRYWLELLDHAGDVAKDYAVKLRAAVDKATAK